jgi:hypothetical protein
VFQDDVFVSGLQDGSTQPVVVIMLGSLGRRRKRQRADWGTGCLFWLRTHCRGLLKYTPCPSFRNALSNTTKKHGELLGWGLIGASRLMCRIQRRTISIRKSERHVSNQGAMIYACRAPVLYLSNWCVPALGPLLTTMTCGRHRGIDPLLI